MARHLHWLQINSTTWRDVDSLLYIIPLPGTSYDDDEMRTALSETGSIEIYNDRKFKEISR